MTFRRPHGSTRCVRGFQSHSKGTCEAAQVLELCYDYNHGSVRDRFRCPGTPGRPPIGLCGIRVINLTDKAIWAARPQELQFPSCKLDRYVDKCEIAVATVPPPTSRPPKSITATAAPPVHAHTPHASARVLEQMQEASNLQAPPVLSPQPRCPRGLTLLEPATLTRQAMVRC